MSKRKCCYKGCQSDSTNVGTSFFRFPVKNNDRCLEWILRTGNDDFQDLPSSTLGEKRICGNHFASESFQNATKKRLNQNAIPLMFELKVEENNVEVVPALMEPETNDFTEDSPMLPVETPIKTDATVNTTTKTSRKNDKTTVAENRARERYLRMRKINRNLKLKLLRRTNLQNKISSGEASWDIFTELEKRISGAPLTFVKSQLRVGKKVGQWTEEEKQLGLALYYRSLKSYKAMLRMGFKLPSVRIVREWVNSLNILPGVETELISKFGSVVRTMDDREKQCVLLFDEMTIKRWLEYDTKSDCVEGFEDLGELGRSKKVASHALVFMVRGLTYNWKMPVAYYLSAGLVTAEKLIKLLYQVIDSMTNIGLQIRALVCNQDVRNQKLFRLLDVSVEKPFILVGGKKIYTLFDFAHLLKSLRNDLIKHDFALGGKVISWRALELLYSANCQGAGPSAPSLSRRHIHPGPLDDINVKLVSQVFGHSVHTSLLNLAKKTSATKSKDELTALGDFVGKISHIFEAMNSKNLCDRNQDRRPLNLDNKRSTDILQKALQWLPRLHVSEPMAKDPPTFDSLKLSITSVLKLWQDLQSDGVKYLITSRLQQDPVEKLFSIISQKIPSGGIPTVTQFRHNFQYISSNHLLSPPKTPHCEDKKDRIIGTGPLTTQTDKTTKQVPAHTSDVPTNDTEPDEQEDIDLEANPTDRVESDQSVEVQLALENPSMKNKAASLEDNVIYYFSSLSVQKTLAKFDCDRCRETLLDRRRDSVAREQILQFFKVHPTKNQAPSDNLAASSEKYWQVTSHHLHLFEKIFPGICQNYNVIGSMVKNIVDQDSKSRGWFGGDCHEHRIFLLRSLLNSRLVQELQWTSIDSRESQKKRTYCAGQSGSSNSSPAKKFRGR